MATKDGGRPRDRLRVTRMTVRGGCRVVLEGTIDERANLKKHFDGLTGTIVIDLDKTSRMTSFGVLEWRSALREMQAASYYAFIRCRPNIVTQFNLVDGFGERGELISLYLPYICSACSNEFELLVDLRHHYFVAVSREPPYARCRKCGAEATFDGLPNDFLSYVGSRPRPYVPPAALPLIDGLVGDVVESLKVRKDIDSAVTRLNFSGPVAAGARLSSAMEGIEGFLVIDMHDVTSVDDAGMRLLADSVRMLSVVQCCYARLPVALFGAFSGKLQRSHPDEGLCSILVNEQCPKCQATSDFEVTRRSLGDSGAEVRCPSCHSTARLSLPRDLIRQMREVLVEPAPEIMQSFAIRQEASVAIELPGAASDPSVTAIVGESAAFREVTETLRKVAPTNASILLRGETGTGKEMLARLVHSLSQRADSPFVAINCAALPENLIESELFGHERGSFTGATQQTVGRFERAHGGTLFIDEVGDIPVSVQVKLLRALQEKYIERIGSANPIRIDIRLIAATHRSLEDMMEAGLFREDLFFRISVVPVFVPPLRQRPTDIWPIALHYLGEAQRRAGRSGIRFSERMRRALEEYSWPGNVRELINVVERAVALTDSQGTADLVDFTTARSVRPASATASLPPPREPNAPGEPSARQTQPVRVTAPMPTHELSGATLKETLDDYERRLIEQALVRRNGNRTHAARDLGISRQALVLKIAKYSL